LWYFVRNAAANINSDHRADQLLGWAHLLGVLAATVLGLLLVLPPAFKDVWAYQPREDTPKAKSN
jgi:hypothetical protein